jgi:hypothetical protein
MIELSLFLSGSLRIQPDIFHLAVTWIAAFCHKYLNNFFRLFMKNPVNKCRYLL